MNIKKIGALMGLFVVFIILAGCAAAQNATPTTDPKLIYTQVAQTVQAQITSSARLTPKASTTPPPTDVPSPTATKGTPNPTSATTKTPNSTVPAGTPGTALPTLPNTIPTNSGPAPAVPDKMLYVGQGVPDGTKFNGGDQFTMFWTIKNVGTTTWDKTYRVRLYGGDRLGVNDFPIPGTVAPQQSVKLSVEMTAPKNSGKYEGIWVLTNTTGVNFGYFTFALEVK